MDLSRNSRHTISLLPQCGSRSSQMWETRGFQARKELEVEAERVLVFRVHRNTVRVLAEYSAVLLIPRTRTGYSCCAV